VKSDKKRKKKRLCYLPRQKKTCAYPSHALRALSIQVSPCQLVLVAHPIIYVCKRNWCGLWGLCAYPKAFMREVLLEFLSGVPLLTHSDGKLKCF